RLGRGRREYEGSPRRTGNGRRRAGPALRDPARPHGARLPARPARGRATGGRRGPRGHDDGRAVAGLSGQAGGGALGARRGPDHERLREGELVYTGALRTPAEAIAHEVALHGAPVGVSAEGFALAGDVHLWLGSLAPEDYTVPTPDGRPATREFAGERLARVICADRELLDEAAIEAIARSLADAQVARVSAAVERVARRHPRVAYAVVTGLGDFIAAAAA